MPANSTRGFGSRLSVTFIVGVIAIILWFGGNTSIGRDAELQDRRLSVRRYGIRDVGKDPIECLRKVSRGAARNKEYRPPVSVAIRLSTSWLERKRAAASGATVAEVSGATAAAVGRPQSPVSSTLTLTPVALAAAMIPSTSPFWADASVATSICLLSALVRSERA